MTTGVNHPAEIIGELGSLGVRDPRIKPSGAVFCLRGYLDFFFNGNKA